MHFLKPFFFGLLLTCLSVSPAFAIDLLSTAINHLRENQQTYSLVDRDFEDFIVKTDYRSLNNGIQHIVLRQQHMGIELFNGDIQINLTENGDILNTHVNFMPSLYKAANTHTPELTAVQALEIVAQHLRLSPSAPFAPISTEDKPQKNQVFVDSAVSLDEIPVKLMYQVFGHEARLVWAISIRTPDHLHWWQLRVDTVTGKIIGKNDWVANNANGDYFVYPLPMTSPEDSLAHQKMILNPVNGDGTVVGNLNDLTPWQEVNNMLLPSPFAWHDDNGKFGADYEDSRGNNVFVQADPSGLEDATLYAFGGKSLLFDDAFNPNLPADQGRNHQAAITNVFYWNNTLHDILYRHGFDEAAGNFQLNNYVRGGLDSDPVLADVHDGALYNQATFATPPDGQNPRMQLGTWDTSWPHKDGAVSNSLIIHEYTHGMVRRLTGGASNSNCLTQGEGLEEGWADWLALALTTKKDELGETPRGFGMYLLNQPLEGEGMRVAQYSTDMGVNPYTYEHLSQFSDRYDSGFLWATMLWDVYWALITEYGFERFWQVNRGWKKPKSGNQLMLQLVIDGLKLQPCQPSFTEARDAILLAEQVNNDNKNYCLLWTAFARRGLGFSANANNPHDLTDGQAAFDLPRVCRQELLITHDTNTEVVQSGEDVVYQVTIENNTSDTQQNVTISETLDENTQYVVGSSNCAVTENNGTLTFNLGDMAVGDQKTCDFAVTVGEDVGGTVYFNDNVDTVEAVWVSDENYHEGNHWTFDADINTWLVNDKYQADSRSLMMKTPVILGDNAYLSFLHNYDTENGFDGGVVEISRDGGLYWQDIGHLMTENGYNQRISNQYGSDIGGREAFSGLQIKPIETRVDLSAFKGESVQLRFNMVTDNLISQAKWQLRRINLVTDSQSAWLTSHSQGDTDWVLKADGERYVWFANNMATPTEQILTLSESLRLLASPTPQLRFWHHFDTEAGFDGGVVELSSDDGVTWQDIGDKATQNGYNDTLSSRHQSALSGRNAFSGYNEGYEETVIDLSAYAGQKVKIRFRFASDDVEAADGWYIDDIELSSETQLSSQACSASEAEGSRCEQKIIRVLSSKRLTPTISTSANISHGLTQGDATSSKTISIENIGQNDLTWFVNKATGTLQQSPSDGAAQSNTPPEQLGRMSGIYGKFLDKTLHQYGFESAQLLDAGWSRIGNNPETWHQSTQTFTGRYSAKISPDTQGQRQEEWLLSPELDLSTATLSFWSAGNQNTCSVISSKCSLQIWVIVGDIGGGDDLYLGDANNHWSYSWTWTQSVFDISKAFSGTARIGFRYLAENGDGSAVLLDNISIDSTARAGDCQNLTQVSWLDSDKRAGVLAPTGTAEIEVDFIAPVTTKPATYYANFCINSNDAETPVAIVPVKFVLTKSAKLDQSSDTTTSESDTPTGNTDTVNESVSVSGGLL